MEVYLALLIPIVLSIASYFWFTKKITYWEILIPISVSLITILLFRFIFNTTNLTDSEYLSYKVVSASYEEPWNEYIKKECSNTTCTGTGKTRRCRTTYYDCSYVKYHSAEWYVTDESGSSYYISKEDYIALKQKWNNNKYFEMHRKYHTIDGNMYRTYYTGNIFNLLTTHKTEWYSNRVQNSSSIYNFRDLTEQEKIDYLTYDYPNLTNGQMNSILSDYYPINKYEQQYFNTLNARLGPSKQCHVFLVIWKNSTIKYAEMQQRYWKGGNKNEFVINVDVDNAGNLKWFYTFSWTDKEICKIKMRAYLNLVKDKKLNIYKLTDNTYDILSKNWKRKNFADFKFLHVDLKTYQLIIIYIIAFIVSIGCIIWAVKNEYTEK